ncbi:MAG TPA: hypothetical protein DIW47_13570 [Bacteroidetes bacterium]|nr:hypothetical protein [Bacteroidota bacterium]
MSRIFLLLICLLPVMVTAQSKDEELAAQYYLNGEFEKAAVLYEQLWKKNPASSYIYSNYLNTLLALKDYDGAEKMIRSQQKRYPREFAYSVDRAWVLQQAGETEKAKKFARELAEDVKDQEQALSVALALIRRQFYAEAELSFLAGRKNAKDPYLFAGDLAALYAILGKKTEMVNEGVLHVQAHPNNMPGIQLLFQEQLTEATEWDLLIKNLRQNLQKNADDPGSNEMLMWALVQKKDFDAAFIQFRAIDKRHNLNGRRMMELAKIVLDHGDFENAVKCYSYVADLGERNPYYFQAKYGLLEVRYNRVVVFHRYDPEELKDAEKEFRNFIRDFGPYFETEFAERQLAHLYIFYLDRPDTAIFILKRIAESPRVKKNFQGEVKLELGDAYLMMGEVWDAELIYSQVDKDFKEDILGQEAKYRMARLFYFKGEFERSNAYLEVLKTATTQLISNNAIDLSLLILDNTGMDTTEEAMKLYADAELLIYRNKVEEGMNMLSEIEKRFPGHSLQDEILYARAKAYIRMNQADTAIYFLQRLVKDYPYDILADNALFMMAQLYEFQKNDPAKAMEFYEQVLLNYPASLFVVESRKRYRILRGDKPDEKENKQIMFDRFMN